MRLRHFALPAAAATLALGGFAAPAQAEPEPADPGPIVAVVLPEQVAVLAGKTKTIKADVLNVGSDTAKNAVVRFENVSPAVKLTLPAGCEAMSCTVGDLKPGARKSLSIGVAITGDQAVSRFTAVAGEFPSEVTVIRSAGGVDLELAPLKDLELGRGESATLPITIQNAGSETVDTVGVAVAGEIGLTALGAYRNCLPLEELEGEEGPDEGEVNGVMCLFDEKFEPGAVFQVPAGSPLKIQVDKDAGGPYSYGAAAIGVGLSDKDAAKFAKKKTGSVLSLDTRIKSADLDDIEGGIDKDLNPDDNLASFVVSVGKSAADAAAVGTKISGNAGDTKTFEVGLRNLGPTTLIPYSGDLKSITHVRVAIPDAVKVTESDDYCFPDGDDEELELPDGAYGNVYICLLGAAVGVDKKVTFAFKGKLRAEGSTDGSIVVDGGVQDNNSKNNTAPITVSVKGGSDGGQGGGLPITGAPTGWVALGGALLLLVGGAAAFLFRRRRVITTL